MVTTRAQARRMAEARGNAKRSRAEHRAWKTRRDRRQAIPRRPRSPPPPRRRPGLSEAPAAAFCEGGRLGASCRALGCPFPAKTHHGFLWPRTRGKDRVLGWCGREACVDRLNARAGSEMYTGYVITPASSPTKSNRMRAESSFLDLVVANRRLEAYVMQNA